MRRAVRPRGRSGVGTGSGLVATWLAVALAALALPATATAAPTDATLDPPAASATGRPGERLDRIADGLRRSPLWVDPELRWMLPAAERRAIRRALAGSAVPVLVVALPVASEDESGGDEERIAYELRRRTGKRDALYVVVNERAVMDLEDAGVKRYVRVPFDVLYPSSREERRGGPSAVDTLPARLRRVVALVNRAPVDENPTPPDEPCPLDDPDGTGPGLSDADREDRVAGAIGGVVLGGVLAVPLVFLLRRRARRVDEAVELARRAEASAPRFRRSESAPAPAAPSERPRRRRRRRRNR